MGEEIDDKRTFALITGGSSGIGASLARELAKRGHDIAIIALPNSGQEEVIPDLENRYEARVESLEINLLDNNSINRITEWIESREIRIQVLVNNAGMGYASPFEDLDAKFISTLLDLNIKATTLLTHAVIPFLKLNERSFILNISSAAAFYSMPYKAMYSASKKYIMDFSMAIKEELKQNNVSVTAVCPAGVITSDEIRERIKTSGWLGRKSALEPEQVALETVNGMLKNRTIVIPGRLAKLMALMRFVVPSSMQRRLIAKSYRKNN